MWLFGKSMWTRSSNKRKSFPIWVIQFHFRRGILGFCFDRIWNFYKHDNVIKWKHFPRYWLFVREIHRLPVNSPHKCQWHGALTFSLICARINGWVNNREAGDSRRHGAHCDVIVMYVGIIYILGQWWWRLPWWALLSCSTTPLVKSMRKADWLVKTTWYVLSTNQSAQHIDFTSVARRTTWKCFR